MRLSLSGLFFATSAAILLASSGCGGGGGSSDASSGGESSTSPVGYKLPMKAGNYEILGILTDNKDEAKAKANAVDALTRHPDMACIGDRIGSSTKLRLRHYLESLRAAGLCGPDVDLAVAANTLSGTVFADAMGRDVHPHCYPYSAEEAPQRYVEFFLRAIGARAAEPAAAPAPEAVVHHA